MCALWATTSPPMRTKTESVAWATWLCGGVAGIFPCALCDGEDEPQRAATAWSAVASAKHLILGRGLLLLFSSPGSFLARVRVGYLWRAAQRLRRPA